MTDLAARIVAIAARLLHADRPEWGAAMIAELADVRDRKERLHFAFGCARAALFAPTSPNASAPSGSIALLFLAGVAGCLAVTAYVLATWPHAGRAISDGTAVWFAASLVVYAWFGLQPPRVLIAFPSAVRRGVTAGLVLFIVTAIGRSAIDAIVPPSNDDKTLGFFLIVTVGGTVLTTAFAAARADRSVAAGLTASFWVGLVCSIVAFNADLFALLSGFNLEVHIRHIMSAKGLVPPDVFMSEHVGDHLASSMNALGRLPVITLIVGFVGAVFGRMSSGAERPRGVATAS